jgi:hypothetical protein
MIKSPLDWIRSAAALTHPGTALCCDGTSTGTGPRFWVP